MNNLDNIVSLIVGGSILAVLIAVAFYVLSKIRRSRPEPGATTEELLDRFSGFYEDGSLTREEFRAIKRSFAESLKSAPSTPEDPNVRERNARLEQLLRAERR